MTNQEANVGVVLALPTKSTPPTTGERDPRGPQTPQGVNETHKQQNHYTLDLGTGTSGVAPPSTTPLKETAKRRRGPWCVVTPPVSPDTTQGTETDLGVNPSAERDGHKKRVKGGLDLGEN